MQLDQQLTFFFNGSQQVYLNGFVWTLTQTSTWIPLFAVLGYCLFRHYGLKSFFAPLLCIALCVFISDQIASSICKPLFARWRPSQDPTMMHFIDVVRGYRGGNYGFFSSHAANTSSVAVFLTLLLRHKGTSLSLFAWSLLSSWTRLYLGVHFVSDLLVGLLFGACVAWVVYKSYMYLASSESLQKKQQTASLSVFSLLPYVFLLTLTLAAIPWRLLY